MLEENIFEFDWPIDQVKDQGLYAYGVPIESYCSHNYVRTSGTKMLMFGSYSYLGLSNDPRVRKAACDAIRRYGTGTHGVRLLAGTFPVHRELEETIAGFLRAEDAVTFSSAYSANISAITSLVGRRDAVIGDKLNHASLVDACGLSKAKFMRYRHNDMNDLENRLKKERHMRRRLVVTDGVFSMDGDIANLPDILKLCQKYNAILMVDEAHGLGVLGKTGRGIEEHFGLPGSVDIRTGSLSKAVPSVGGYAVGSRKLCEYLRHLGRGFVYSAPIPPGSAAAALAAIRVLEAEPGRLRHLRSNIRYFAKAVAPLGLSFQAQQTPIFPVLCGSDQTAWELAAFCRANGVYVQAIPHPIVPEGTARLRVAITATHTRLQMGTFIKVLRNGKLILGMSWGEEEKEAAAVSSAA